VLLKLGGRRNYQIGASYFIWISHFTLQETERILPVFAAVPDRTSRN